MEDVKQYLKDNLELKCEDFCMKLFLDGELICQTYILPPVFSKLDKSPPIIRLEEVSFDSEDREKFKPLDIRCQLFNYEPPITFFPVSS